MTCLDCCENIRSFKKNFNLALKFKKNIFLTNNLYFHFECELVIITFKGLG